MCSSTSGSSVAAVWARSAATDGAAVATEPRSAFVRNGLTRAHERRTLVRGIEIPRRGDGDHAPNRETQDCGPVQGNICGGGSVAARLGSRFALATIVAVAVVALSAPVANADLLGSLIGNNCPTTGNQVFAPWNDFRSYYLAPNGGLENGSNGWSLSGGAYVVSGNQPF